MKECKHCSTLFHSDQPHALYCSKTCKQRESGQRKYKRRIQREPTYNKKRYLANRESILAKAKIYRQRPEVKARAKLRQAEYEETKRLIRVQWRAEIKNHPCADCGIKYPHPAMDWHHPNGDGGKFKFNRRSKADVLKEIEEKNCVLLCANCHRLRHARGLQ